jgi:DHA1 family bicyclomycin/chloramphenicol resistance-like MFS transporter
MKETAPKQRFIGRRMMVVFLSMLSSFPALSTDLYLPALPSMAGLFGVSDTVMNLTLVIYFISFSVTTLVWGPLSDKYGRRPILIIGAAAYLGSSLLCAVSGSVALLIVARALQGGGGAATTAIAMAVIKDIYKKDSRESVIAVVQAMVVICPTLAPVIGAFLMNITSWRGIFVLQGIFALIVLAGGIALRETIPERENVSVFGSMKRLGVVMKNPSFAVLLAIFALLNAAQMAYIGSSAYIYQNMYGLGSQVYTFFFAINALAMLAGPFIFIALSKKFNRTHIITACLLIALACGAAIMISVPFGPLAFTFAVFPSFVAMSAVKPSGAFLMLEQQKKDTGSASSLINCGTMITGTIGIAAASIEVWDFAHLVGLITLITGIINIILWLTSGQKISRQTFSR